MIKGLSYDQLMSHLRHLHARRNRAEMAYSLLFWTFLTLGFVFFTVKAFNLIFDYQDLLLHVVLLSGGGAVLTLMTMYRLDDSLEKLTQKISHE